MGDEGGYEVGAGGPHADRMPPSHAPTPPHTTHLAPLRPALVQVGQDLVARRRGRGRPGWLRLGHRLRSHRLLSSSRRPCTNRAMTHPVSSRMALKCQTPPLRPSSNVLGDWTLMHSGEARRGLASPAQPGLDAARAGRSSGLRGDLGSAAHPCAIPANAMEPHSPMHLLAGGFTSLPGTSATQGPTGYASSKQGVKAAA